MFSSPTSTTGLLRTYLMRGADALASATATYAIPLLVLVTTGSTALTGVAFLLEWSPRLAAFAFAGSLVDRWGAAVSSGCRTWSVPSWSSWPVRCCWLCPAPGR